MLRVSLLLGCVPLFVGMLFLPCPSSAAEPTAPPDVVDLFAGMADGQLAVEVIAKNPHEANLLVTNKTGKPLSVRLPEAAAAQPVLAQFNNNVPQDNNNNKATQTLGTGFPPNMFGPGQGQNQRNPMQQLNNRMGNNRQGGNNGNRPPFMFNIAPEQIVKMELPAVCLNYGKPNPRAAMHYELKQLSEVTDKPGLAQVCALLSDPTANHTVVQLAAWHLSNDMSWDKFSSMRRKTAIGARPRYSEETIKAAKKMVEKAVKDAEEAGKGAAATKA